MGPLVLQNTRLRNALAEMVTFEEHVLLNSYWPLREMPIPSSKRRLCASLARVVPRDDLARVRRARRALGACWWGSLDYADGLRPGQRGRRGAGGVG